MELPSIHNYKEQKITKKTVGESQTNHNHRKNNKNSNNNDNNNHSYRSKKMLS